MKKKQILIVITLIVLVCSIVLLSHSFVNSKETVFANDVWDGSVATYFEGGSGIDGDPYQIANAEQLALLSDIINNGTTAVVVDGGASVDYTTLQTAYYELTTNISLNDETFTFDADTGLVVMTDGMTTAYLGTGIKGDDSGANTTFDTTASVRGEIYSEMTGSVGAYFATVHLWNAIGQSLYEFNGYFDGGEFEITGLYINNTNSSQGLFGYTGSSSVIENINIVNSYIRGFHNVGSIAGMNLSIIRNCYNAGEVNGIDHAGGLIGYNKGTISNCYNEGNVTSWDNLAGGITGKNKSNNIINCYNTGNIRSIGGMGYSSAGGISAVNSSGAISECYNAGTVTGENGVGGIIGSNLGKINSCYNTANVTLSNSNGGGISGLNSGQINNCYNTANVTSDYSSMGGISGYNSNTIKNCYNIGIVKGSWDVGGVVGVNYGGITQSYYLAGCAEDSYNTIQYGIGEANDIDGITTGFNPSGVLNSSQTLGEYSGTDLLSILNAWVEVQASNDYLFWSIQSGINDDFPIFALQPTNSWTSILSISGWTYGEQPNSPTAVAEYGTVEFTYSDSEDGVYTPTVPTDAGIWWVKAIVIETEDYVGLESVISFEIEKVELTEPTVTGTYIYTGSELTVTYTGYDDTTMSVSGDETGINTGTYTLLFTIADTDNYEWATGSDGNVEWEISKAQLTEPTVTGTYIYTGSELTVTYTGYDDTTMSVSGDETGINTGTYTLLFTIADTDNYEWATGSDGNMEWIIQKAINNWIVEPDIEEEITIETFIQPEAEATYGDVIFVYSNSENGTYGATVPTEPGNWWVKAIVEGTDNYLGVENKYSFVIPETNNIDDNPSNLKKYIWSIILSLVIVISLIVIFIYIKKKKLINKN